MKTNVTYHTNHLGSNSFVVNPYRIKLACLFVFFSVICSINSKSQDVSSNDICKEWNIIPMLYNKTISDSTKVLYWQNYWYYRDNPSQFIPDTLVIDFIVYSFLYYNELSDGAENDSIFNIIATFYYKYGEYEDSYNLINPKKSESRIILNSELNFNHIRRKMTYQNDAWLSLGYVSLPLIEMLMKNNIFLQDGPIPEGRIHYLNQLVFIVYLNNLDGLTICTYEFIFPINGAYGDDNCCK